LGSNPLHQATSLRAICSGTLCNKDSDRHTLPIDGQMYRGVEPLLCAPCPDSLLWLQRRAGEPCNG
jgi:hypothetical protein